ncbi:hypothetical protein AB8O53_35430, partial [Streptomyces pilosus]
MPLPETVFAQQVSESGEDAPPAATAEARTALIAGGSQLPPTAVSPAVPESAGGRGTPPPPAGPGVPERPLAPNAGDIADAATSKAT